MLIAGPLVNSEQNEGSFHTIKSYVSSCNGRVSVYDRLESVRDRYNVILSQEYPIADSSCPNRLKKATEKVEWKNISSHDMQVNRDAFLKETFNDLVSYLHSLHSPNFPTKDWVIQDPRHKDEWILLLADAPFDVHNQNLLLPGTMIRIDKESSAQTIKLKTPIEWCKLCKSKRANASCVAQCCQACCIKCGFTQTNHTTPCKLHIAQVKNNIKKQQQQQEKEKELMVGSVERKKKRRNAEKIQLSRVASFVEQVKRNQEEGKRRAEAEKKQSKERKGKRKADAVAYSKSVRKKRKQESSAHKKRKRKATRTEKISGNQKRK